MGSDADMEDYGFEYSDDEPEEQDVDIENQYYNSKGMVETDPEGALNGFGGVVRMEPEKAEWGFKALKQTVKLYYKLGKYKEMMDAYREMLTYIKSAVTRNYSEKCINNIMDFVSGSASQHFSLLQEFYQTTLKALEEAKNERLWFKTNLKLCKIWFDMGEYGRMSKILKELHKSCQKEDGSDDQKKGTQLLEVYAIEIQMYTETKNNKKLKSWVRWEVSIRTCYLSAFGFWGRNWWIKCSNCLLYSVIWPAGCWDFCPELYRIPVSRDFTVVENSKSMPVDDAHQYGIVFKMPLIFHKILERILKINK
uniref:Uncharacterized protein n=1 Tax=Avena sativa TaxID=4498 RepID=A0ACD5VDY7_AVESA